MLTAVRKQAWLLVVAQSMVILALVVLWWALRGFSYAVSAGLGGFTALLPHCYFIYYLFRREDRTPTEVVRDFYIGELAKLVLSIVLLLLLLKLLPVKLLASFSGFIGAYLAVWLLPLLLLLKRKV